MTTNYKELNGKISEIKNFKLITTFVESLLKDSFTPFIFINLNEIVISEKDPHRLIQPEIENLLKLMNNLGLLSNVTFFSDKNENYRSSILNQVLSLTCIEGWNLRVTSGYVNFTNAIQNRIINSSEIKNCYKPWFIYIDIDSERIINIMELFSRSFDIYNSTIFHVEKSTWESYIQSFIFNDKYEMYTLNEFIHFSRKLI